MWSPDSVFGLLLVAGLAGGLGHCSGMCGPLVLLLSPREAGLRKAIELHLGRLISYALVGGTLAGLSSLVAWELEALPARPFLMVAAGAILVLGGLATLGLPFLRGDLLQSLLGTAPIRWGSKIARSRGHFVLGLFWGLLPCGLLYTAYAAAAGAGVTAAHPAIAWLRGAAVMLLFGLGTTPTLLGIAWAAAQVPLGARIWLQRLAGLVVAVSGLLLIWHAWS